MEEGVKGSDFFVLFLTANNTTPITAELRLNVNHATLPAPDSPARLEFERVLLNVIAEKVALKDYALDDFLVEYGFAEYADQLKEQGVDALNVLCTASNEESHWRELAVAVGMTGTPAAEMKQNAFVDQCAELQEEVLKLKARLKVKAAEAASVLITLEISEAVVLEQAADGSGNQQEQPKQQQITSIAIVECLQQIVEAAPSQDDVQPADLSTLAAGSDASGGAWKDSSGSGSSLDLLALLYPQHPVVPTTYRYPESARRAHARAFPRWVDDDESSQCMQCQDPFWSVDVRTKLKSYTDKTRHHCRSCGWLLCEQCCPADQMLPMDRWVSSTAGNPLHRANPPKPKRVCNTCFECAPAERDGRIAAREQYKGPPRGYAWIKQPNSLLWPERYLVLEGALVDGTPFVEPETEPSDGTPVAALTADGNDQVDDGSGGGDGEAEAESEPEPEPEPESEPEPTPLATPALLRLKKEYKTAKAETASEKSEKKLLKRRYQAAKKFADLDTDGGGKLSKDTVMQLATKEFPRVGDSQPEQTADAFTSMAGGRSSATEVTLEGYVTWWEAEARRSSDPGEGEGEGESEPAPELASESPPEPEPEDLELEQTQSAAAVSLQVYQAEGRGGGGGGAERLDELSISAQEFTGCTVEQGEETWLVQVRHVHRHSQGARANVQKETKEIHRISVHEKTLGFCFTKTG